MGYYNPVKLEKILEVKIVKLANPVKTVKLVKLVNVVNLVIVALIVHDGSEVIYGAFLGDHGNLQSSWWS